MSLNTLPYEIVARCFSYSSAELLTDIILLENISDNILQAAAENLDNLWYSKRVRGVEKERVESTEAYYETDFDRFLRIHKILEEKSLKCPLWFHFTWKNIFEMHQNLDEINLVCNGQKLGIHADLEDGAFQYYPILSDHDINLKITCLSLKTSYIHFERCIDLNNFPRLETFYGYNCEISVDHNHLSLKNVYLDQVTFSSLPTNLVKLVASRCCIRMSESHLKLKALKVLALECTLEPFNCSSLVRSLWNEHLEHFSCIGQGVTDEDEIFSKLGSKMKSLKLVGSISARVPTQLCSLYSINGENLETLTAFSHMRSLILWEPSGNINSCKLPLNLLELILYLPGEIDSLEFPLNLLKLSITSAKFKDLTKVEFPPKLIDLEVELCDITLTTGWLKPAQLKNLSLARNKLSSFNAFLPCCEHLCLKYNKIKEVRIEAPFLQHLDLNKNKLTSIPKLPACVKVLMLSENKLDISQMSELPSNVKLLDLCRAGTGALQNYTFPSSIQELNLSELNLSGMNGVRFSKGSRLKELNMSNCRLTKIDDKIIELPFGLKSLTLLLNNLHNIDDLTIPPTVTFLDLGLNQMRFLNVNSLVETLYLNENSRLWGLTIPKDLELRFLDLTGDGFGKFPFDLVGAEKLTQLRLGWVKEIDLSKLPVNLQILEYPGPCKIEDFHRYPNTDFYRQLL